mmetsp:Transcript_37172/g.92437  ORF Transcript_37172/g.92437 Transcript_37172/m.92437 type:complete len:365 (+) Transcript_37172:1353-2447(+)
MRLHGAPFQREVPERRPDTELLVRRLPRRLEAPQELRPRHNAAGLVESSRHVRNVPVVLRHHLPHARLHLFVHEVHALVVLVYVDVAIQHPPLDVEGEVAPAHGAPVHLHWRQRPEHLVSQPLEVRGVLGPQLSIVVRSQVGEHFVVVVRAVDGRHAPGPEHAVQVLQVFVRHAQGPQHLRVRQVAHQRLPCHAAAVEVVEVEVLHRPGQVRAIASDVYAAAIQRSVRLRGRLGIPFYFVDVVRVHRVRAVVDEGGREQVGQGEEVVLVRATGALVHAVEALGVHHQDRHAPHAAQPDLHRPGRHPDPGGVAAHPSARFEEGRQVEEGAAQQRALARARGTDSGDDGEGRREILNYGDPLIRQL